MKLIMLTYGFIKSVWKDRKVIWNLAKNDFHAKFVSSFLGGAWGIIQPLVTLTVMWFVFQVGLKNPPVHDVPFIVWLAPAFIAWSFFSDVINQGTGCLIEYNYLVKKLNFHISLLPIMKIVSASFIHFALIVFLIILLLVNKVALSIYAFQVVYFYIACCALLLGMCWFLSALAPFVKDVTSIVSVFLQIGFWATPIFWSADDLSLYIQVILRINPMFYICTGYRDCFVDHKWFWERPVVTSCFWVTVLIFWVLGAFLFKKLRPQFADVL